MKIKINLFGRHSNRTPFSYHPYKTYFESYFSYTDDPIEAKFIISGFDLDFRENEEKIKEIIRKNPKAKFLIVSEEPLWDTIWCKEPFNQNPQITIKGPKSETTIEYLQLNHFTSDIFKFKRIPYFITTDDIYFSRYAVLFSRNVQLDKSKIEKIQRSAPIDISFMAAKRMATNLDFSDMQRSVFGLSRYRSLIAEKVRANNKLLEGQDWTSTSIKRQLLADWHLDKIATIDKKSKLTSAFENTHAQDYISEKIFDAFATLSQPIYFAKEKHSITKIVPENSFIHLNQLNVDESVSAIENALNNFQLPKEYLTSQKILHSLFKNPTHLRDERHRVVREITEKLIQKT